MFKKEDHPFLLLPITPERDQELFEYLESKFKNEKLVAINMIGSSIIYLDFEMFCQASMLVQSQLSERMKSNE